MSLFWTGVGTIVIYVGIFIVVATFYTARGFGTLELVRLRWAGRPAIPQPGLEKPATRRAPSGAPLFGPFANGHYWLYLLHAMVDQPDRQHRHVDAHHRLGVGRRSAA